uniref:ATP synthase F0 subunit 8 n=1 Tax=Trigonopterus sp. 8 AH-2016 TaxID=1903842 RepID=A0A343C440_9CUCU|nr:ATP synthase F0 subunit 8 [Trigonopterus sp. 8 AH-2016]
MPQMAPMNWTLMYLIFSMLLLSYMTLNYFLFTKKITSMKNSSFQLSYKLWK